MNNKGTMMAACIHAYGGPEQLHYEEVPVPQLGVNDQILVRVRAASINPIDIKLASGMRRPLLNDKAVRLPWIPGGDFSGTVVDVSPAISNIRKGDAVYGDSKWGGSYAPYVIAKANAIALKPKTLNYIGSASVPLAAQTAWQALFEYGQLRSGQTVLIHGGSGGVGTFAIQLAHWKKANVLATSSKENTGYLHSLGADLAIEYKDISFDSELKEVDVVIDLVGGETQERFFSLLKPGGYLVSSVNLPSQELALKHNVHAVMMTMKPSSFMLSTLAKLLDTEAIKVKVTKVYSLSQAQEAWMDILTHHIRGKIVLEVPA